MQQVSIRVFGKSSWVNCGQLEADSERRYFEACNNHDLDPQIGFFLADFLPHFNLKMIEGKEIKNWRTINSQFQLYGFPFENRSTVEIKVNQKKIGKFPITQILSVGLLFPLFETADEFIQLKSSTNKSKTFLLEESFTGVTGHYKFNVDRFDVSDLKFKITHIALGQTQIKKLISEITYKEKIIPRGKDDSLVIGQQATIF